MNHVHLVSKLARGRVSIKGPVACPAQHHAIDFPAMSGVGKRSLADINAPGCVVKLVAKVTVRFARITKKLELIFLR